MKNYTITATDSMEDRSNGLYNIAYDGAGNYVTLVGGIGSANITTSYNGGAAVQRHANVAETYDTGIIRYFSAKWHIAYFYFSGVDEYFQYSTSTDGVNWTSIENGIVSGGTYTRFKNVDIGIVDSYITWIWSVYFGGQWEILITASAIPVLVGYEWGVNVYGTGFDNGSIYTIWKTSSTQSDFYIRKSNIVGGTGVYVDILKIRNFTFTVSSSTEPLHLIKHTQYTWFLLDRHNNEVWLIKDRGYEWFATKILTKMACITFDEAYLPTHITCLNTTTTRNVYKIAYGGGLIKCPTIATTYTASALPYGSQVGVGLEFLANDVAIATYGFATYTDLKVVNWDNNYDALDRIPHLRVQNVEKTTITGDQILADDADRIGFQGFKERSKENVDEFAVIYYKAYIANDLNRAINYHGNATWANILIDIIQRNCLYLDPTSIASSATLFNVTYKYQTLSSILNDAQKGDAKYVTIDPDGVVRLNDGSVASGVTLTSVGILANDTLEATISRVILNNIVAATSDTIVGGDYIDFYPSIQNTAQLEAIAQNILDAQSLQKITLLIDSAAVPYLGKTYTLTVTELGITAEEWICYGYSSNYPEGKMNVQFVNALYVEAKADVTLAEQRTSQIIEGQIPAQYLQVEDEGNFKHQHADDWGTTGTPTTLTETMGASNSGTITTNAGHNYAVEITRGATAGQTAQYSKTFAAISLCYISQWIWSDDVTKRSNLYVDDGTRYFYLILESDVIKYRTGGVTTTTTYTLVDNIPYHVVIYWNDSADNITVYLNGRKIISITIASATGLTTWATDCDSSVVSFKTYFDALYIGTSKLKAWSSLNDGVLSTNGVFAEKIVAESITSDTIPVIPNCQLLGYVEETYNGNSLLLTSATNNDTCTVDFRNNDIEDNGDATVTVTTNNLANLAKKPTATIKYIALKIIVKATVANIANLAVIYEYGGSGALNLGQICPPVANYESYAFHSMLPLSSTEKATVLFGVGGGATVSIDIRVLGYWI